MRKNTEAAARFPCRRTLRLRAQEDARLVENAAVAGISVSEYMRRMFFGGRPVVARADDQAIRELRRLGGLLKHGFDTVRAAGMTDAATEMDATLTAIRRAIETLSEGR